MLKAFKKLVFQDQTVSLFQQNVEEAYNQFLNVPFLQGNYFQDVSLASGSTSIAHKLNRNFAGYIILKKSAAGDIYLGAQTERSQFLVLTSSAALTVDLWVF